MDYCSEKEQRRQSKNFLGWTGKSMVSAQVFACDLTASTSAETLCWMVQDKFNKANIYQTPALCPALFVVRGGSQGNTFCTSETFNKTTYSKMPF
jgi:hypothetical protein